MKGHGQGICCQPASSGSSWLLGEGKSAAPVCPSTLSRANTRMPALGRGGGAALARTSAENLAPIHTFGFGSVTARSATSRGALPWLSSITAAAGAASSRMRVRVLLPPVAATWRAVKPGELLQASAPAARSAWMHSTCRLLSVIAAMCRADSRFGPAIE